MITPAAKASTPANSTTSPIFCLFMATSHSSVRLENVMLVLNRPAFGASMRLHRFAVALVVEIFARIEPDAQVQRFPQRTPFLDFDDFCRRELGIERTRIGQAGDQPRRPNPRRIRAAVRRRRGRDLGLPPRALALSAVSHEKRPIGIKNSRRR